MRSEGGSIGKAGSTAACLVLQCEGGGGGGGGGGERRVTVANVGDARALLIRGNKKAERLTVDHKADVKSGIVLL